MIIDKKFVHKKLDENVFISNIEKLSDNEFSCKLIPNLNHSFFFEHDSDHIPAIMLIESCRQFFIASCHMYGNVPFEGFYFIVLDMGIKFLKYIKLDSEIIMYLTLSDLKTRSLEDDTKYWAKALSHISIHQDNIVCVESTSNGRIGRNR